MQAIRIPDYMDKTPNLGFLHQIKDKLNEIKVFSIPDLSLSGIAETSALAEGPERVNMGKVVLVLSAADAKLVERQEFLNWFDPHSTIDLVQSGSLGKLFAMPVITDANLPESERFLKTGIMLLEYK